MTRIRDNAANRIKNSHASASNVSMLVTLWRAVVFSSRFGAFDAQLHEKKEADEIL